MGTPNRRLSTSLIFFKWVSNSDVERCVTGASDESKLVWNVYSVGTNDCVSILTATTGTDQVYLQGTKPGRATITVEDSGSKGPKAALSCDIEVTAN